MNIADGIEYFTELFQGYDAWLVGSAAKAYEESNLGLVPKDWDILIQGDKYPDIARQFTRNSYGGREYQFNEFELDLWLDNVATYLRKVSWGDKGIAVHLATKAILTTGEYPQKRDITVRETFPRLLKSKQ